MQRLLTGLALILVGVYLIFYSPAPVFLGAAVLMGFLCFREYADLVVGHGIPKPHITGMIVGVICILQPAWAVVVISLGVVAACLQALRSGNLKTVLPQAAGTIFGAVFAFLPWRFATDLRQISVHLLFFALASNWVGDSAAFYVGRKFGRHRLAPVISPNKSWEGAIASVLGAVVFGLIYLPHFVPHSSNVFVAGLAIASNVAGQLGDLSESAMKRGAGVKDSGQLLPGHGGILDRMDSSLFSVPVVYGLFFLKPFFTY